jgi:hypothetical protein
MSRLVKLFNSCYFVDFKMLYELSIIASVEIFQLI